MSLNRSEQRLFDYVSTHKEERTFWQAKVAAMLKAADNEHVAADRIEVELWRYYVERSEVVAPFKEAARLEGLRRTSLRNLADLLLRLWTEPRPKAKPRVEAG